jgi:hypothetical protein
VVATLQSDPDATNDRAAEENLGVMDDPALDDAIQVATVRTASAQTEVVRSIDAEDALPEKAEDTLSERTEIAVNRAEDLHVLAEEAAGEPDASR